MTQPTNDTQPTLSLNKETGYYEGTVRIQVDAEIFRNMMLQAVKEDEAGDLTKPETWQRAINRVGSIAYWMNRPHVKVIPIALPVPIEQEREDKLMPPPVEEVKPVEEKEPVIFLKDRIEQDIRGKAQHIPPYLWEERLLPLLPETMTIEEKRPIYRDRSLIRQILPKLLDEYKHGDFVLDEEAEQQERLHQEAREEKLTVKLEAVAGTVNGHRLG